MEAFSACRNLLIIKTDHNNTCVGLGRLKCLISYGGECTYEIAAPMLMILTQIFMIFSSFLDNYV